MNLKLLILHFLIYDENRLPLRVDLSTKFHHDDLIDRMKMTEKSRLLLLSMMRIMKMRMAVVVDMYHFLCLYLCISRNKSF
jgi:hypothetical protein